MSTPSLHDLLRQCPAHQAFVSRERLLASWNELLRERINPDVKPTVPIMAAVLLHDERFGQLLNRTEQEHLQALINLAISRYEQQTNPPNPLGKLIAGIIKNE